MDRKDERSIALEWDRLAALRYEQIVSGKDLTYNEILVPEILDLIAPSPRLAILDVGCGVGVLTKRLADAGFAATGIDPSRVSIDIAMRNFGRIASFYQESMESYVSWRERPVTQFRTIIANMVMMDVLSLPKFLASVVAALHSDGQFVFSLTHPCFWPEYYGYASESWFSYDEEIAIESPFRISADGDGSLVSTHVHRPLHQYFSELRKVGLELEVLREPFPSKALMARYPMPWKYPRYLMGRCSVVTRRVA